MKPSMPSIPISNKTNSEPEQEVLRFAHEQPQLGQATVAQRLQQAGMQISASGVRYIWKKHGLETAAKRLQMLTSGEKGQALSKNQQHLLDRNRLTQDLQKEGATTGTGERGRRTILLNTAAELFAENGFDRTSMRDIASSAGLLPGSVYHYFPSKTELFLVIHQEGFKTVMNRVKEAAGKGSDPWDSLSRAIGMHITCMVGDSPPVQRLTGQSLAMSDHPELRGQIQPYREAYENIIRRLIDDLPLPENSDRTLLRLTLLGASNWIFVWYREGGKTPQEIAQGMVQMLRNGVCTVPD